jgi:hypothetical protein
MRDWVIPAPLSQPVPRKVKMTGRTFTGILAFSFILCALIIIGAVLGRPDQTLKMLEERGIEISGTVTALQHFHGTRRGSSAAIDYIYQPKELAGKPDRIVHVHSPISLQNYGTLRVGGAVPLIYDPLNPQSAELKSVAEFHRNYKGPKWWVVVLLILAIPIGFIVIVLAYLAWAYVREKNLLRWGKPAKATILQQYEEAYRGSSTSKVTYTFQDDHGATWMGLATIPLGGVDDPRPNPDLAEIPTALYDPRNSANNMLYPGNAAELKQ